MSSDSKKWFICKLKGQTIEHVKVLSIFFRLQVSVVSRIQRVGKNWLFVIIKKMTLSKT